MYDELVKRLRESKNEQCYIGCFGNCGDCKIDAELEQAADAIEELVRKEKFHVFLWNTIQPNEMEQYLSMYRAQAVPSEPPQEE